MMSKLDRAIIYIAIVVTIVLGLGTVVFLAVAAALTKLPILVVALIITTWGTFMFGLSLPEMFRQLYLDKVLGDYLKEKENDR